MHQRPRLANKRSESQHQNENQGSGWILHGILSDDLAIKLDLCWREAAHEKNYQRHHAFPPKVPKTKDGSGAGSPYWEYCRSMLKVVRGWACGFKKTRDGIRYMHARIQKCAACTREASEVAYNWARGIVAQKHEFGMNEFVCGSNL